MGNLPASDSIIKDYTSYLNYFMNIPNLYTQVCSIRYRYYSFNCCNQLAWFVQI